MHVTESCDFLIAGAGFGGSLTALILHQQGYRVILFDSGSHPRFSIGESSTPLADACLKELCHRYGLSGLAPLCAYGSARRELPQLVVGLKRGFSYFKHSPASTTACTLGGTMEQMLVTAASSDEQSDTHWLRSSVDSHFADQVRQAGITLWEETRFERLSHAQPWQVDLSSAEGITRQVKAKFLIDASGRSAVLASPLRRAAGSSLPASASDDLLTHSRAVFGHFRGVQPWHEMLVRAQVATTAHPFSCDRAAVHHLIQHGWMWQLNFDNGVTSLGFAIEPGFYAALEGKPAAEQFRHLLQSYPMLQEQLANAECVAPAGGLQASGRLQYLNLPAAGQGWACLPAAVGFVDPLHSTGIAHTLYSVRALARIFASGDLDPVCMAAPLQSYSQRLEQELRLIDRMVYLCYATLQDFDCFAASCMLYFAASTYAEASLRSAGELEGNDGSFLNASSPAFWQVLHKALKLLAQCQAGSTPWHEYPTAMARLIRPFNLVGLCDPTLNHMYSATSASVES